MKWDIPNTQSGHISTALLPQWEPLIRKNIEAFSAALQQGRRYLVSIKINILQLLRIFLTLHVVRMLFWRGDFLPRSILRTYHSAEPKEFI